MLTNLPVGRAVGPRVLLILSLVATLAIHQWLLQLQASNDRHGLTNIFFTLFVYHDRAAVVCMLLILVVAALAPIGIPARQLFQWVGDHPGIIAGISAIVLACASLAVYRNHPLSMDEYAAYFQSQAFAAGHLNGRFPVGLLAWLIPPGFENFFIDVSRVTGDVASAYWPAFALILTPFTWAGIPWACNPTISALTVLGIHRLAMKLFADREAAGLAVLLTVASPVFFANGISYYSMPAHLLGNTLFAVLLVVPTPGRALLAGVVGSIALTLHNPVPHMLFALPWLIWISTRPDGVKLLMSLVVGYLPLCVVLGLGWFWFSGQLIHQGAPNATAISNAAAGLDHVATAFALPTPQLLLARLAGIAKVWIWAVPGLLVLACNGAWRWRHHDACRLLTASALLTLIGYVFVPVDQGHGWGFRYFHSAWIALPILATAALFRPKLANACAGIFEDVDTRAYVGACVVLSLVFAVGMRAADMHAFIVDDLAQIPSYVGKEPRVVIINTRMSFYGQDLVQNDPWLRGNVMYLYSRGMEHDAKMMADRFPNLHQVYADRFGTVWSAALRPR